MNVNDSNSIDLVRDFLQKLVDHLPISLFCKDARHSFQYVMWNETASCMWGRPLLEVVGRDDFEIFPADIAAEFRKADVETMAGREVIYIPQEIVPTPGGFMTARTWKIPIYGEDRGPQWLLGISQDISEPRLVGDAKFSPVAQLAHEALAALENGQTDLARALLKSIQKLG